MTFFFTDEDLFFYDFFVNFYYKSYNYAVFYFSIISIRIISEARSYGETTVQPPTKSFIQTHYHSQTTSIYDKPLSTIMMDEANTMAERDMGSTFLLPHTHLYKPDRVSGKKRRIIEY